MKIAAGEIERFVRDPGPDLSAVLVYGPDGGLVRERARIIAASVVEDLADPFRVTELTGAAIRDDPARLSDEASALSLIGGRRVVRLREAGDAAAAALDGVLATASPADILVVVEAGDLGPRSKLRKLFEGAAGAAALPCYGDDARTLGTVIRETLGQAGLGATPDAMAYLSDHLGSDRMLTRMELEKLATYSLGKGEVTLEDAEAVVGDGAATTLDDIVNATTDGNLSSLDRSLQRAFDEGVNSVAVVRAAQRHFHRLHRAAGDVAAGIAPDQAMKKLRPPVFFKRAGQFRAQLQAWNVTRIAGVLEALTEAEIACKTTGVPAEASCRRTLLAIARRAAQLRGNRR
jgi:DNA polymerase-3 subunit delta